MSASYPDLIFDLVRLYDGWLPVHLGLIETDAQLLYAQRLRLSLLDLIQALCLQSPEGLIPVLTDYWQTLEKSEDWLILQTAPCLIELQTEFGLSALFGEEAMLLQVQVQSWIDLLHDYDVQSSRKVMLAQPAASDDREKVDRIKELLPEQNDELISLALQQSHGDLEKAIASILDGSVHDTFSNSAQLLQRKEEKFEKNLTLQLAEKLRLEDEEEAREEEEEGMSSPGNAPEDPLTPFQNDLLQLYLEDPAFFSRAGRGLPQRLALMEKVGATHEQIEGWASILSRNVSILPSFELQL